jgi:beta-aspartyl-peptidase (threonine type)
MTKTLRWLLPFLIPILGIAWNNSEIEKEITRILAHQRISWNKGDLESFMSHYWQSNDFTFQSGGQRLEGWESLRSRYQKSYAGENMGKLNFSDLVIKVLSKDIVLVLGRWEVQAEDSLKGGLFTLVFQRKPEGWRIIHDHTSSGSD